MPTSDPKSGIRDNHSRGSVGDFLRQHLKAGADLDLVTASITATFQQSLADGLQGSRQFVLPTESEQPQLDSAFELVTWLVLLAPETSA